MKIIIIIQARMGSTRLPGKILKKVMGRTMIEYQIERLKKVGNIDNIVVATTHNKIDDSVQSLCEKIKCSYFRGSEHDVLSRFYMAALKFEADCIVRINADCPLIDPGIVEEIINYYHLHHDKYDYISNILEESYPIGLHTEVFSMEALSIAHNNSKEQIEREHVTPYIYRNPDIFRIFSYTIQDNLSKYRWTVDYPEDFELIRIILEALYKKNKHFNMIDIINFVDSNPSLMKINGHLFKEQIV